MSCIWCRRWKARCARIWTRSTLSPHVFPAGTLSGAPKVRAMQIIEELEPMRRGIYGGSVLYADFAGNLDSCIGIRTMLMQGKSAYLQAGAGIVADSDPAREFQESMNKAQALLRAVEMARSSGQGSVASRQSPVCKYACLR